MDQSPGVATLNSHQVDEDRKKEPASCCNHGKSTKPVQTEASWLFSSSVDVAVETSRSIDVCKSTQASLVAVKVHRWTETTDLVESKDSDTHVQEIPAPHVRGMPRLTNMDQSPGVSTLYTTQVDEVTLPALGTCGSHRLSQDRLGYEEIPSSHPAALVRPLPSQHKRSSLARGSPGRCSQRCGIQLHGQLVHATAAVAAQFSQEQQQAVQSVTVARGRDDSSPREFDGTQPSSGATVSCN
ncbi:uncharacterized protein LOC119457894 [Dermacentor silvarum]|uniref:uncharacterized protein LOC119457894 n=1 Tax=Dermacentor silvarum TaxID=543639 RepID=UPI0021017514|nr:uncharacterized protein LOC119457894 [Dermacentor silvarum]